jgi:hypothetical protein
VQVMEQTQQQGQSQQASAAQPSQTRAHIGHDVHASALVSIIRCANRLRKHVQGVGAAWGQSRRPDPTMSCWRTSREWTRLKMLSHHLHCPCLLTQVCLWPCCCLQSGLTRTPSFRAWQTWAMLLRLSCSPALTTCSLRIGVERKTQYCAVLNAVFCAHWHCQPS